MQHSSPNIPRNAVTENPMDYLPPELHGKEIVLCGDGINWIWYCHVLFEDGYATILKEYRLHKYDDYQGAGNHPKAIDSYRIVENSLDDSRTNGRIAFGIMKGSVYFPFKSLTQRWNVGK